MKTIAQIAQEIGVSKQAVHKKIKQEPLSTSLQKLMTTDGNKLMISVSGENLIKKAFNKEETPKTTTKNIDVNDNQFTASLQLQIQTLSEQNKDLRIQLNQEREHSRKQADEITELAKNLAHLANNAQHLHAGELMPRLNPTEPKKEEPYESVLEQEQGAKRNFLKRIFKKNTEIKP